MELISGRYLGILKAWNEHGYGPEMKDEDLIKFYQTQGVRVEVKCGRKRSWKEAGCAPMVRVMEEGLFRVLRQSYVLLDSEDLSAEDKGRLNEMKR